MQYLGYILYMALTRALGFLPLGLNFFIGECVGLLAYVTVWPYRRLVMQNLRAAYAGEKTESELRRIALNHFRLLGANVFSSVKSAQMSPANLAARLEWEGVDGVIQFLTAGHGVVGIVNHMSNWEMLAAMPHFYPQLKYGTVFQRLRNPLIDADIRRSREKHGVQTFDRRDGFAAPIQFVKNGGILAILADQHAGDGGVWTPFYGKLASTSPLAATIARRAEVPIVPMGIYTIGRARWKFVFGEPMYPGEAEPEEITARINCAIEKQVRLAPEDWFWVHDRWKTPRPRFLLSTYHRGVAFPEQFDRATMKPFRILIRSSNWLGDAVMTIPAVREIKTGRPDAHVTILTKAKLEGLWKRVDAVDAIVAIPDKASVFGVASRIRGQFDVAVLFPNSLRTALEVWLAGIPRRVGYPGHHRKMFLNQILERRDPGPLRHQAHDYLDLAEFIGAVIPAESGFGPSSRAPRSPGGKPRIGICSGAEYGPAKRWPAERFAQVVRHVATKRKDLDWVLFGLEADREAGTVLWNTLNRTCDNLIGKTNLDQLIEELSRCDVLLTNDTGSMHLAAFLGVRTVSVFGSTEPALTGPIGPGHTVVRKHVECSPCFLRECPLDFRCMNEIPTAEVVDAVLEALPPE